MRRRQRRCAGATGPVRVSAPARQPLGEPGAGAEPISESRRRGGGHRLGRVADASGTCGCRRRGLGPLQRADLPTACARPHRAAQRASSRVDGAANRLRVPARQRRVAHDTGDLRLERPCRSGRSIYGGRDQRLSGRPNRLARTDRDRARGTPGGPADPGPLSNGRVARLPNRPARLATRSTFCSAAGRSRRRTCGPRPEDPPATRRSGQPLDRER